MVSPVLDGPAKRLSGPFVDLGAIHHRLTEFPQLLPAMRRQHVYCHGGLDPEDVIRVVRAVSGIEAAYDKWTAARFFELPLNREGDVVVVGCVNTCIGAAEKDHDLSGLRNHRLRTHGALHESRVPFILNRPLRAEYAARAAPGGLHSYHLFDFAINGVG